MIRSTRFAITALAVLGVTALAGCAQPDVTDVATGGDGDKPTFRFAVVAEETGNFAGYGTQLVAGVKAAVKDINAAGEYNFTMEPVIYDCQSDQAICVQKTRQAITSDELPVVIGPIVSVDIIPSAEVTNRAGVPHLVMAVLPAITGDYDNTFRWGTQNDRSNQTVIDYVEGNLKTGEDVAIVNATTDFGKGGAAIQTEQLAEIGVTPALTIGHDPDQADYTPVITQLKELNPRYVLLSDSNPADVAKLLRQSKELGLESEWIGADASGSIDLAGDAAIGYMTVSPWYPTEEANSASLAEKLQAQGIEIPGWIAAMAYDATIGLAEAVATGGTTSEEIWSGLEGLSEFDGLARDGWDFSKDHMGLTSSTIAVWNGAGYESVWPN